MVIFAIGQIISCSLDYVDNKSDHSNIGVFLNVL